MATPSCGCRLFCRFESSPAALAAAERGPHSTAGWLRRHFMKAFLQFSQGHRGLLGVPHASGLSRGAAPRGATAVWQTVPSQSNELSPSNVMVKRFETCRGSFTRGSPGSQYQNIFRSSFISPPRVRLGFFLEKKSDLRHAVGPGIRVPVVRQAVRNVQSRLQFVRSTRGENVSPPAPPRQAL